MIKKSILNLFGLNISRSVSPGFNFGNINFSLNGKNLSDQRAGEALKYALSTSPKSVLDVGSGGGFHARSFREKGAKVDCVDYGTSVYAKEALNDGLRMLYGDFNEMFIDKKYDLVWASHVLEHQRNIGVFLEKLISCCVIGGIIIISVPSMHRKLLGGHLSLWSPGLLAYNVVLAGVDLSESFFINGSSEISLVFSPKKVPLPDGLTFDKGDIYKLESLLPPFIQEGSDQFLIK